MQGDEQVFSLKPWRGQWAHLPLTFLPFALMVPLALAGSWVQAQGFEQAGTALGVVAGLGFAAGVFAMPLAWRRFMNRGAVVLRVGRGNAELATPEGRPLAVTAVTPQNVRSGVFEYRVMANRTMGTYRSPLIELTFPERRLVIGGEGVPASAGGTPEPQPGYLVAAADWPRLVAALGA